MNHIHDETDWQLAVCLGLGMSQLKSAEYVGITDRTLLRHKANSPEFFDRNVAFVRGVKENALTNIVAARSEQAEDRIKGLFNRAFKLTEKAIERAEKDQDDLTLAELIKIHKEFTVWSASFAASQAPKRVEVKGEVEHTHSLVPASVFAAIQGVMREQKLLPEAIEAQVVEPTQ